MARKNTRANTKRRTTQGETRRRTRRSESARTEARERGARGRTGQQGSGDLLSRTTLRAKWIESPDEHEDYPGQTLATRNHDVIRRWAEERQAQPATVPGTEHDGRPGVLTFDFPGYGGERLKHVSWDEWFRTFDERNLVYLFQERLNNGRPSNHFHFDSPEREAA
jgi:hypothetical protein